MTAPRYIMGVDPGLTGAIAFWSPDNPHHVTAEDIPVVGGEIDVDTLRDRIKQMAPTEAVIERVASMPKQGVSSMFKFGAAYGALRATVACLNIPCRLVTPPVWKKHYRLIGKDKEASRALAIQYWPGMGCFSRKKDHGRAEAALLARWVVESEPRKQGEAA